ncbi:replication protein RepA [Arsukibacterium ikkense]|uniref:Replication protein RepA n=1 Tax=Arsukibacterium ikkense TaxID=336831 RepID=A0A0M2V5H2_9GAMM|nr:replication protein RepA [Arsukibacterium ikkense]
MALSDLKKKCLQSNKPAFTADEFIDDANNYALGLPRIVSLRQLLPDEDDTTRLPMRHATFTLSEEAIAALNELSDLTGEAKSKLIRRLILRATQTVQLELTPLLKVKNKTGSE